jgi:hypothetical protein
VAITPHRLQGHKGRVLAVAVTPDGCRAVSASEDRTLRIWELESGQSVHTLEGHTRSIEAVAITPDGSRAVSASTDRTLRVWDLANGQTLRVLEGHTKSVQAVATMLAGRRAISNLKLFSGVRLLGRHAKSGRQGDAASLLAASDTRHRGTNWHGRSIQDADSAMSHNFYFILCVFLLKSRRP